MGTLDVLTRETAKALLTAGPVFVGEESKRPWCRDAIKDWDPVWKHFHEGDACYDSWDRPLLRTYDSLSGSIPDFEEHDRMLARAPRMRLDTEQNRKEVLAIYADHKKWEDTPFISFTNDPQALERLARGRTEAGLRGNQNIVVIDRGFALSSAYRS